VEVSTLADVVVAKEDEDGIIQYIDNPETDTQATEYYAKNRHRLQEMATIRSKNSAIVGKRQY
jgi:hypothetical protein